MDYSRWLKECLVRTKRSEVRRFRTAALSACVAVVALPTKIVGGESQKRLSFESKLDGNVEVFDSEGQTLVENVLSLACQYQLPLGVEYLDRGAVSQRLRLQLRGKPVREILLSVVAQAPQYRLGFSGGCVQLYSPRARADPSNLLNAVVDNFQVSGVDPQVASAAAFEALVHETAPKTSVVESTALGTLGPPTMTLHLKKAKVYEILDTIVANHGAAVWVVRVPPDKLSTLKGTLWYIYPLQPPNWREAVLGDVTSLFPAKPTP